MKGESEILNNISEIKDKRNLIIQEIDGKTKELEYLKRGHSKLVTAEIGKQRKSGALTSQRAQIDKLNGDIEELEDSNKELERELEKLNYELEMATAFQEVESYKASEKSFFEKTSEVFQKLSDFDQAVEAFQKIENPLELLNALFEKLKGKVSLARFFESGEIEETIDSNNEEFIEKSVKKYFELDLAENLGDIFDTLEQKVKYFKQFAKMIATGKKGMPHLKQAVKVDSIRKIIGESPLSIAQRIKLHPKAYDDETCRKYGVSKTKQL